MTNLSKKITIPIFFIIVGGSFTLGLYFGNNKFDRDKISLSDENKVLKGEKTTLIEKYNLLKDSVANIKTKISLNNNSSQKEILVYNNTNSQKRFYYFDKNEGKGSSYLINPKQLFQKTLLGGNVYDYSFHNVNKNMDRIDTLKKGEFIIRIPRKEFLLIE